MKTINKPQTTNSSFAKYAWFLLGYNILVILWGAYVRASGSGAGCGSHWPACNGSAIPSFQRYETVIEFVHRITSGIILPMAIVLAVMAYRNFPKGNLVRLTAVGSLAFVVIEALLGAGLVLFGLVDKDDSLARALVMSAHLCNTFLLLANLSLTAWWGSGKAQLNIKSQGPLMWGLIAMLLSIVLLGMSGAIAALGDTLFPATSIIEGLRQELSPTAHFLIRLKLLHPLLATCVGLFMVLMLGLASHLRPSEELKKLSQITITAYASQLLVGLVNVSFLAPIEIQIFHLLMADIVWVTALISVVVALAKDVPQKELEDVTVYAESVPEKSLSGVKLIKAYVEVTKPRVISLLLFTTLAGACIAEGGIPNGWLLFVITIAGYMISGAANAINMVIDRDIDAKMVRTSKRPTVTKALPSRDVLIFAFTMATLSFGMFWSVANLLSAMLSLAGLAFYVIVYTLMLKRRTWQNIVIGGAAGSFPPLVGYAAVSGELSVLAWVLFGIIFFWTPVHFWALALLIKDDYAKVGVPMLPVVHGERATVIQIMLYAVLTAALCVVPFLQKDLGLIYLVSSLVLNGVLLSQCVNVMKNPERQKYLSLYKFSMLYLALLFTMIAIDRAQGI